MSDELLKQSIKILRISFSSCTQVHGVTNDTIKFVQNIINTEINSATDNPVSFSYLQTQG